MSEEPKRGCNFEKLEVWQPAIGLSSFVDGFTQSFPADERFGITNQMRRAAVSISSNIAEGSSRSSRRDFARFVELAVGSLYECVSQGFIAPKQGFLDQQSFKQLYAESDELIRMLSGLRNHLRS
ncbi:MAG: four helix bundle protein [Chthoniobacterales bacterium]